MSFGYNHVSLAGNLTRQPVMRQTPNSRLAAFGLAIDRRWRSADGDLREETTFVDCEAWGRTGELVLQYLTKGSPVLVAGRLRLDSWEDKEGKRQSRLKVVCEQVRFLPGGPRVRDDGEAASGADPDAEPAATPGLEQEPPF